MNLCWDFNTFYQLCIMILLKITLTFHTYFFYFQKKKKKRLKLQGIGIHEPNDLKYTVTKRHIDIQTMQTNDTINNTKWRAWLWSFHNFWNFKRDITFANIRTGTAIFFLKLSWSPKHEVPVLLIRKWWALYYIILTLICTC